MADDFCSAATAQSKGIIAGAAYWYMNWTGRFSANLLDSFFGYLGPEATPYATGLVLILWLAVLTHALHLGFRVFQLRIPVCVSFSAAAIILFVVLDITPSVAQSLYWGQGMRSVIPPLMLATACIALLAKSYLRKTSSDHTTLWCIIAGLLTFIAGGFSETYVAVQTFVLAGALGLSLGKKQCRLRRQFCYLLAAAFIGSLGALVVVVAAPGNQFRRTPFPAPPNPVVLTQISWAGWFDFTKTLWSPTHLLDLIGLIVVALLVGSGFFNRERSQLTVKRSTLLWLPIIGFLLVFLCHVPIAYGASLTLPDRTLIIPAYLMVAFLFTWSYLLGGKVSNTVTRSAWTKRVAAMLLLAFGVWALYNSLQLVRLRPTFKDYSRAWAAREHSIRSAKAEGKRYVVVSQIHNWASLDEVEPDPKILWLTKCVQDYYGILVLPQYAGKDDPNAPDKQLEINAEFQTINPPSEATPADVNFFFETGRGRVGFFNTGQSYEDLKSYYNAELGNHGWRFMGDRKVEIFQKYTGGVHALFCKGNASANLFYTGSDRERLGYSYSLALNWESSSGFVWGVEDCRGAH